MSHVDDGTLHAYLDGKLAPVERARFEAHVAECAACRGRLEEERALIERASNLLALAQPPDRSAPPLHELRRPRLAWRLRVPLAWAATVVLALGIGYYVGDQSVARAPEVYGLVGDSPASNAGAADSANNALARRENTRDGFATAERRRVVAPPQQTPPRAAETQKQAAPEPQVYIDGNVVRSLRDSAAAASGVVAIRPQDSRPRVSPPPTTQPPAPQPPAMAAAIVQTGTREAGAEAPRDRLVATQWAIIRRGPARDILGAEPVGIPGLAVRNIRRSPSGEVVLVEQSIDSATVIQLFQERVVDASEYLRRDALQMRGAAVGTERLARFIGGMRVEIAGPLSADSLNRLLEQVKPIGP